MRSVVVRLAQQHRGGVVSVPDQVQPGAYAHPRRAWAVRQRYEVDRADDDLAPVRVLDEVGKRHVQVALAPQADQLMLTAVALEPCVERHLDVDVLEPRVAIGHDRELTRVLAEMLLERSSQRCPVTLRSELVDGVEKPLKRPSEFGGLLLFHGPS